VVRQKEICELWCGRRDANPNGFKSQLSAREKLKMLLVAVFFMMISLKSAMRRKEEPKKKKLGIVMVIYA
jgi:hypothetical protein